MKIKILGFYCLNTTITVVFSYHVMAFRQPAYIVFFLMQVSEKHSGKPFVELFYFKIWKSLQKALTLHG